MLQDDEYADCNDKDDVAQALYDTLFIDDSVTGNASGSYTFSTWQAEENLCHNMDLLKEACDVTIRCYLLPQAISNVLGNREDELDEAFTKLEEQDALDGANLEGDER